MFPLDQQWNVCSKCGNNVLIISVLHLRTKLQNILTNIVATACLHIYAMRRGEVINIDASEETNSNNIDLDADGNNNNSADDEPTNIAGTAMRRQIITQNF